jgi:hypothetical protein
MIIWTVKVDSWSEIDKYFKRGGWLYRGQRSADWNLETSFERLCQRNSIPFDKRKTFESELIREFQRGLYQYESDSPSLTSKIEWLALMQHHGAPTRLLDFTYSLYVAAYFALEDATDASAVW